MSQSSESLPQVVYTFSNGTQVVAPNVQDAFRAFRVLNGAAPAIMVESLPFSEFKEQVTGGNEYLPLG